MTKVYRVTRERFEALIERQPNGCAIWRGPCARAGTPQSHLEGLRIGARRIAWFYEHGELPAYARNTCGNRLCVLPAHASIIGDYSAAVREAVMAGEDRRTIAKRLGIDPTSVSHIISRSMPIERLCACGCRKPLPFELDSGQRVAMSRKYRTNKCRYYARANREREAAITREVQL